MFLACGYGHCQALSLHTTPPLSPFLTSRKPALRSLSNGSRSNALRRSSGCHGVAYERQPRSLVRLIVRSLQSQEPEELASEVKVALPLVKMCGITNAEDAAVAARAGANYIGMIVWPKSKRSVSVALAREIAVAARANGAEPVGVFVDESAAEIERACREANLGIAQLHGDGARASLSEGLPDSLKVIYVLHADKNGMIRTSFPQSESGPLVDWVLVDSLKGGSGEQFDWRNFQAPSMESRRGWLLAGGLTPSNVATALSLVMPNAVDVSSGIAGSAGIRKDPTRIYEFIKAVQNCSMVANVG